MSDLAVKMVLSAEDKASKQIKDVADQVNRLGQQTLSSGKDMSASFRANAASLDEMNQALERSLKLNDSMTAQNAATDSMISSLKAIGSTAVDVAGKIATVMYAFTLGSELGGVPGGLVASSIAIGVELTAGFRTASAQAADLDDNLTKLYTAKQQFVALGITEKSINAEVNALIGDQLTSWSKIKENLPDIAKEFLRMEENASAAIGMQDLSVNDLFESIGKVVDNFTSALEKPKSEIDALLEGTTDKAIRELTIQLVNDRDAINQRVSNQKEAHNALTILYTNYTLEKQKILAESAQKELATYQSVLDGATTISNGQGTYAINLIQSMMEDKFHVMLLSEEKSNAAILNSTEIAQQIRLGREAEFRDKLLKIIEDYQQKAFEAERKASGADILEAEAVARTEVMKKFQAGITGLTQTGHAERVKIMQQERDDAVMAFTAEGKDISLVVAAYNERMDAEFKRMNPVDPAIEALKRLKEAWADVSAGLDIKIAGAGVDELTRKLIELQGEADKLSKRFEAIPEAGAKIKEWAQAMSDSTTAKFEDASYQNYLAKLKTDVAEEVRIDKERQVALRSMFKDNKDYSGTGGSDYYQSQIEILDKLKEKYTDFGIEKNKIDVWYDNQYQKIQDQQTLDTGSFMDGVKLGYSDMIKAQDKWGAQGKKAFDEFKKAGTSAISDGLFSVIKGDITDFSKLWQTFADSLLKTFTNVIAEMIMTAATKEIAINFKTSWVDSGANVINFIAKAIGYAGSLFSSASSSAPNDAGSTYANHNLAYGGWVGGGRYGGADSYANDTVHIMGSPGEYMVPKSQVNAIAAQGRNGDSLIAHINPAEAALLKAIGGSGTTNPRTGLPEFFGWSDIANLVTGGVYGGISGDYGSLSGAGLAPYFSPWVLTAEKVKHSADIWDIIDAVFDPITGPGLDELTRKTGKAVNDVLPWMGQAVEVIAPTIGAIVGSYFGPLGTAGGAFGGTMLAGKWNDRSNAETMKKAAIASAIAYVASSASEFVTSSTAPSTTPEQAANNAYTNAVDAGLSEADATAAYEGAYQSTLSANSIQGITSSLLGKATAYATKWVMGQAFGAAFPPEQGQVKFDYAGASDGGLLDGLSGSMDKMAPESFSIKAPMFANGGAYPPGGMPFWAGEKGPELVFPGASGGQVLNHDGSLTMTSGNPEIIRLLTELIAATKDGKVITIDGKAFGAYTRTQAETVVTSRIDRGMVNDSRRLYN